MKVSAVKKYNKPRYPERALYELQPNLLASMIPQPWLKNKAVMATLLAFILSGAKIDFATDQVTEPAQAASPENAKKENKAEQEQAEMKIAPMFMHGEGRGATGCVVISAPVFLSEAEAVEIIFDELKKNNIPFDKRDVVLPDFLIEGQAIDYLSDNWEIISIKHPFIFDGFNTKYNLGFKFINMWNYFKLGGIPSRDTVQDYDFIKVAYELKEKIKDTRRFNAVVFYDPVAYRSVDTCQTYKECKIFAKQLLKEQVRDFISWLKIELDPINK